MLMGSNCWKSMLGASKYNTRCGLAFEKSYVLVL